MFAHSYVLVQFWQVDFMSVLLILQQEFSDQILVCNWVCERPTLVWLRLRQQWTAPERPLLKHEFLIQLLFYIVSHLSECLILCVLISILQALSRNPLDAERLTVDFFSECPVIKSIILCAHNVNDSFRPEFQVQTLEVVTWLPFEWLKECKVLIPTA